MGGRQEFEELDSRAEYAGPIRASKKEPAGHAGPTRE